MHKTGACLQLLGLRGDPRWQARELTPNPPRGQPLLGDEHILSISEVAI
jgi:hypothetical protein